LRYDNTQWVNSAVTTLPLVTSFNGLTGAVTGVTTGTANNFIALQSFTTGISASGGVTFAGTLQGTTANFTGLVSSTVGFSGAATNLTGNASGLTAGSASRVQIAEGAGTNYYLALANGAGNTGIFVDTSSPRWVYNASTGALTTSTGSVSAGFVYGIDGIYSNSITAYDTTSPIIINSPNFDGTSQPIVIGDFNGAGQGTLFTLDDANLKIEIGASNVDCSANMNVKGGNDLRFYVPGGFTYIGFKSPLTPPNNIIWTLPSADGSSNQVLTTNGSGILSWSTPSGGGLTAYVSSFNGLTGAVTGVSRINGLSGGVTLAAGTGITLSTIGNTITIASTGVYGVTASLDFSQIVNGIQLTISGTGASAGTVLSSINNVISVIPTISTAGATYSCILDSATPSYSSTTSQWSANLVLKPPFGTGVTYAETIIAAPITNVSFYITGLTGATFNDNWSSITGAALYHQEETYIIKTLTGITWVTDSMFLNCKVLGLTTADHTPEDAILEGVRFEINNILGGTGFDIIGHAPEGTYGKYTVKCLGQ
jgi:hypothetical protein